MAVVTLVLAWLALGLIAGLATLLFVPADYVISAGTGSGVRLRARWLFGLVRVAYDSRRHTRATGTRPRQGRGFARGARAVERSLAIDGLPARFVRLARELVRSLGCRRGRLALRVGLGDPADTGELCGLVAPALLAVPWRPAVRVAFEPDFAAASFAARAVGSGRFVPARAIAALGGFAVSRPGRQWIGAMLWRRAR